MAEREDQGYEDSRPAGMTVREEERRREAQRRGDLDSDAANISGEGTVSDKIEREAVAGGHGHGGELDVEIEKLEKELK